MKHDEHPVPCLMKHNVVAPSVEMRASEQYFDSVLIQFTSNKEVLQYLFYHGHIQDTEDCQT